MDTTTLWQMLDIMQWTAKLWLLCNNCFFSSGSLITRIILQVLNLLQGTFMLGLKNDG